MVLLPRVNSHPFGHKHTDHRK